MNSWLIKIKNFLSFGQKKGSQKLIDTVADPTEELIEWWGSFIIEEEQSRFFKIGDIVLCLDRYDREWHITSYREGEQPFKTFAAQASNEIVLKPTLPNRALLTKLDRPFYIPMGETLLIYISSPVWIRIEAGKPPILLDEIGTETLADTWFGRNTLEGELCYAGASYCSPRLDELPRHTTRVTSPIRIANRSKGTLVLNELKIPLTDLSIYTDSQNHLWTEQLNIYQEDQYSHETIVIKGPPKGLKNLKLISPARSGLKSGLKDLFSPFIWK